MHQVGLVRVHVAAQRDHQRAQPTVQLLGLRDDDAAHDVGVAVDELGHGVQDDVGAQVEGLLQVGRGEGVVHHQRAAVRVRDLGHRLDVGDLHGRVGGRLDVDQLRVRPQGLPHVRHVRRVHERGLDAEAGEVLLDQAARRPVDRGRAHHVGALPQQRQVDDRDRAHARARGDAALAVLQLGDALLQRLDRRVAQAGVDVAVVRAAEEGGPVLPRCGRRRWRSGRWGPSRPRWGRHGNRRARAWC